MFVTMWKNLYVGAIAVTVLGTVAAVCGFVMWLVISLLGFLFALGAFMFWATLAIFVIYVLGAWLRHDLGSK